MRIYMVRHGETDWNVSRRMQGRSDTELNENGRSLARITAEALKDLEIQAVFSSPLKRARETAQILVRDRNVPVEVDERLIEISFGIYEGLCSSKHNYEIPDPEFANFFKAPGRYRAPEGGEELSALCERTGRFLRDITSRKELFEKNVLVVSHGAAIRAMLRSLKNPEEAYDDFWNGSVPKNLGVFELECRDGKTLIQKENQVFYKE